MLANETRIAGSHSDSPVENLGASKNLVIRESKSLGLQKEFFLTAFSNLGMEVAVVSLGF